MAAKAAGNGPVNPESWEWEDSTPAESQLVMDEDGDEFIGKFLGWTESEQKGIPQAHWEGTDGSRFFINCGWSLKTQLKPVKVGTWCRVKRTGTQDTGQDSPMVLFRVQTRKI